jgi:AcrR family transcriptional regulator
MTKRRRAIKDEDKQQRRLVILDITWRLFQDTPYQAITMSEVAERAGLAKGTLYLYFKTKEELFLAIQEEQLQAWFDAVDAQLQAAPGECSIPQVAKMICGTLEKRPALTRLLAILHIVLEQNIDFDTALRFKGLLLERIARTGAQLERRLPFLAPGQGQRLLIRTQALAIGLQHLADPAPIARRVLEEPGMEAFAVDFAHEFLETFTALLLGLREMVAEKDS